MLNLSILLEASAQDYPEQTAVIFNDRKLSYAQLNAAANMFAHGLKKLGVQKGDNVALMMPNLPFFPIAYYGILKTGATVVPFNVLFTAREVAYHLNDSDAVVLVAFANFFEPAYGGFQQVEHCRSLVVANAGGPTQPFAHDDPAIIDFNKFLGMGGSPVFDTVQTQADDVAVILYTSGTTGSPKGAQLTHNNMVMNAMVGAELCAASGDEHGNHSTAVTLPLFHATAQTVQMNAYPDYQIVSLQLLLLPQARI